MSLVLSIQPGYTFGSNEAITNDKLNAMLLNAIVAVISGTIDTAMVGDGQITAAKLASVLDLSGKTLTMPSNLKPKSSIDPTTTVPDFFGQLGQTSAGAWWVATGTAAGNWKSLDCLTIATQWHADNTNFPLKGALDDDDVILIEDSAASYAKKKLIASTIVPSYAAYFKHGLKIKNNVAAPTTKMDIAATEITLSNISGYRQRIANASVTVDFGTSGVANGLDTGSQQASKMYYLYLIAKADGTVAGMASLVANSALFPSGYSYARLVGEVWCNGSNQLTKIERDNDQVYFESPQSIYSNVTLTTTPTQYPIAPTIIDCLPLGATEIFLEATSNAYNQPNAQVIAPDANTRFQVTCSQATNLSSMNGGPTAGYNGVHLRMLHLGAQSIYARSNYNTNLANQNLHLWGYILER